MLGAGSFAQVFLIKKEDAVDSRLASYYAMKVLTKSQIKEKDYAEFIKLEKQLT